MADGSLDDGTAPRYTVAHTTLLLRLPGNPAGAALAPGACGMCSLVEKQEPFRLAEDQCLAAVNSVQQHVQQAMPAVVNAMSSIPPAAQQLSHSGPQAGGNPSTLDMRSNCAVGHAIRCCSLQCSVCITAMWMASVPVLFISSRDAHSAG